MEDKIKLLLEKLPKTFKDLDKKNWGHPNFIDYKEGLNFSLNLKHYHTFQMAYDEETDSVIFPVFDTNFEEILLFAVYNIDNKSWTYSDVKRATDLIYCNYLNMDCPSRVLHVVNDITEVMDCYGKNIAAVAILQNLFYKEQIQKLVKIYPRFIINLDNDNDIYKVLELIITTPRMQGIKVYSNNSQKLLPGDRVFINHYCKEINVSDTAELSHLQNNFLNIFLKKVENKFYRDTLKDLFNNVITNMTRTPRVKLDIHQVMHSLEEERVSGREEPVLFTTSYKSIDSRIKIHAGHILVIAGTAGVGKTAFALQMIALSKKKLMLFSLEMTEREVCTILNKLYKAHSLPSTSSDGRKWIMPCVTHINDIIHVIREEVLCDSGVRVYVIDHLHFIQSDEENETSKFTNVINKLTYLAKELEIAIIVLAQTGRDKAQKDFIPPAMDTIRNSSAIEQAANSVIMLSRSDSFYWEKYRLSKGSESLEAYEKSKGITHVEIAKNRGGVNEDRLGIFDFKFDYERRCLIDDAIVSPHSKNAI